MDEPFGALDAITRARMQDELRRIQRDVRKTILFVSHDIDEAFKLGDQIAVLSEGKLVQIGSPVEILTKPKNDFVSQLVGADNALRQLQYVPVSSAQENGERTDEVRNGDLPSCTPTTNLLDALLQLLDTKAPALAIDDPTPETEGGYVTIESITNEIMHVRHLMREKQEIKQ
jgi:osmoprotectant transport system ATP-binding protein